MGKIKVQCIHCDKLMVAPDSVIGRKVKCARCQQPFVIDKSCIVAVRKTVDSSGTVAASRPPTSKTDTAGKRAAVKSPASNPESVELQSKPKPEPSKKQNTSKTPETDPASMSPLGKHFRSPQPLYSTSTIGLAMLGAIISLAIYWLSFVAVLAGTIWFGIANIKMLTRGDVVMIPLYIAAIIAGVFLMFLILKPVLTARSNKVFRKINPKTEPQLVTLIERVAATIDSPVPVRLDTNYELGMTVKPLGSWFDFAPDKICLTIGFPILTSFTVEQFVGLLATQLAPYSKPLFTRNWLFVVRAYDWIENTSWRPDQLDNRINGAVTSGRYGPILVPFAMIWNLLILLTNRIPFKLLLLPIKILGRGPLQNQQLNSDQVSYNLVGTDTFKGLLVEGQNIIFANESATNDFLESMDSQYNVTNAFEGLIIKRKYLNEYQISDIRELVDAGKTWSFGAFSSDAQRMEMSEKHGVGAEAGLDDLRSMKELVKGYYRLAAICTRDMANQVQLVSVGTGARKKTRGSRQKRADAINRYLKSAVRQGIKSKN